jgi:hypothetical protein
LNELLGLTCDKTSRDIASLGGLVRVFQNHALSEGVMAGWRGWFNKKTLRRDLALTLLLKLALLLFLKHAVLPPRMSAQQAADGVNQRLIRPAQPDTPPSTRQEPR